MKTYPSPKQMLTALKKHKRAIMRTTMNLLITNKPLSGKVLDIGASHSEYPSYYEFFNTKKLVKKTLLDFYEHKKPDVVGDAQDLPFKENTFDSIICFNLLEHVPEPFKAIEEAARVLNGRAYFYAPYLTSLHSEQKDYMGDYSRLSHATWDYWCEKYFSAYKIHPVAFGPATQAIVLFEHFIPAPFRLFCSKSAIRIDDFIIKKRPYMTGKYLLAVYVEATK